MFVCHKSHHDINKKRKALKSHTSSLFTQFSMLNVYKYFLIMFILILFFYFSLGTKRAKYSFLFLYFQHFGALSITMDSFQLNLIYIFSAATFSRFLLSQLSLWRYFFISHDNYFSPTLQFHSVDKSYNVSILNFFTLTLCSCQTTLLSHLIQLTTL